MNELINLIFAARDAAHRAHLTTRSFAKHLALQKLYEDLPDIADRFAEAYQGSSDLNLIKSYVDIVEDDPISMVEDFLGQVNDLRHVLEDRTDLEAIHDDLVELIQSTLYKLKKLS